MRTIKFRGTNLNGEWVYGFYVEEERQTLNGFEKKYFIVNDGHDYVKPETVGQFTGLHDKDGKEIYEGDMLRLRLRFGLLVPDEETCYADEVNYAIYQVIYDVANMRFDTVLVSYTGEFKPRAFNMLVWSLRAYSVIGNIHDNPELLKQCTQ